MFSIFNYPNAIFYEAGKKGETMVVKRINEELCFGCGLCVDLCTEDVLRFDEVKKKPYVKYPRDCVACLFCEAGCPIQAIEVELTRGRKMPEVL